MLNKIVDSERRNVITHSCIFLADRAVVIALFKEECNIVARDDICDLFTYREDLNKAQNITINIL